MAVRRKVIVALVLVAAVLGAAWLVTPRYYLEEDGREELVCNRERCYLFASHVNDGWKVTGLGYIRDFFIAVLGGAVRPTNQRSDAVVFAVGNDGIQQYTLPGNFQLWAVYRGDLYASCVTEAARRRGLRTNGRDVRPGDYVFGRWTGTLIEPVDEATQKLVHTAPDAWYVLKLQAPVDGLYRGTYEGWTWVYAIPPDRPVAVDLQSGTVTFIATQENSGRDERRTVAVRTSDGKQRVIRAIDRSPRPIPREEFDRLFAGDTVIDW